jgi:hypothetical protein
MIMVVVMIQVLILIHTLIKMRAIICLLSRRLHGCERLAIINPWNSVSGSAHGTDPQKLIRIYLSKKAMPLIVHIRIQEDPHNHKRNCYLPVWSF